MAPVRIEFTVEPFVDGRPGPHVLSAIAAVERSGLPVDVGPFSSIADVPSEALGSTVAELVRAAFEHGATGLTLRLDRVQGEAG
jgi:uncharacterized protein YqgV (UPF0045/DUF77 family)